MANGRARLGLVLMAAMALPGAALAATAPTIANNTFASTPVGQSMTQTVTLTLTSAGAIKSIALATGTAASKEYTLKGVSGCATDGTTVNASGTVCSVSVMYAPLHPGSLAAPNLSRNAQLLFTDGGSNVTAYGLAGAATKAVGHVVPGTISLYAGAPYTVAGTSPLDNGLGQVNGAYAGNGVAATSASFQFATYNAIFSSNVPSNGSQPMAFDSQGNLYVIDGANYIIRKIDNSAQHLVTTIAGTASSQGYTGNGGLATSAKLNAPRGLTLDAAGNIYFLDDTTIKEYIYTVSVIRRIDAVTGIITVVAGQNFNGTTYDSADGGGTCNISVSSAYAVYECGDGGLATYAFLNQPYNLGLDAAGNFYLWASGGSAEGTVILRKIDGATGIITTIGNETNLGATQAYGGMTIAPDGNLYVYVIDTATEQTEVKQFNPTTMVATPLTGTASGSLTTANCQLPAVQQKGFAAADLFMATGTTSGASPASGDLSADASGNLYLSDALCTNGAISVYNFPPSIVRVNIASATAYDEVVADAFPYGGTATIGYNAFYFYNIDPVSAIPDNAGNIFFTSWNQIAELSGQNAELDFTERYDFTTSVAQTATYANLGNESGAAPTYALHSGTHFVVLETGDTKACDVLTAVADDGTCDLDLAFSPIAVGPLTDVLNVSGGGSPQTVTVDGVGDAAPAQDVSPATLAFGNQTLNVASAPKTVTVTDTGTANLTVYGAFPDGTNGFANYEIVANGGTCSTSTSTVLTPGSSCTIEVTFTPSALGPLPASLNLNTTIGESDVVAFTGTGAAASTTPTVTETGNLWFNPAPVAVAAASAQTLTATFTLTGFGSVITPTATMHYGHAYKVGKVTCTGAAGNQTCTVPVTFLPNYPGGRKDALFLMNGTTRLATELAYGIGESPFALIQPGTVTNPILNNAHYLYDSVVDENGTVYVYLNSTIYSVTAAGVVTQLAVPGPDSNSNLTIDGAGILYFGDPAANSSMYVTYDTVQGIAGSVAAPVGATYFDGIAVGNEGNLYMVDNDNGKLYTVKPDGTSTSLALTYDKPYELVVDSNENLFGSNGGNGTVDEITPAGVQTKVNTNGGGLGIDAAETVYLERFAFNGIAGVGELPASDYGDAVGVVDRGSNPTGNGSVGPDGTVYVGNYNNLDKVDRSQQTIAFGEQSNGSASQPAAFEIYNGGNENLILATFAVTGDGFAIQSGTTDACTAGMTIKPGAVCNAPIVFTGTHSGNFTGSITFTSNTLNTTATSVSVPLSAYVNGIYVMVAPSPLNFGNETDGTTSGPKTVTFTNTGVNADASIGSPSSVDGFTISQGTCTASLAPGASCAFNVTFSPIAAQAYTGTVNVTASTNASTQQQSLSFTVNGTGTTAMTPPPPAVANLEFAPATVNLLAGDLTASYTGDGGPAVSATLNRPYGIAYDAAGNLYIADSENYVIRKVDTAGKISTFAGNGTQWQAGNDGDDGPALSAEFNNPDGVAVDASGNVYVADKGENVVRKIDTTGKITLFAGSSNGYAGYGGDGGPATSATLDEPVGIGFDPAGNLYIADSYNEVVRQVDTSGKIHTFAGTGLGGYSGDGGTATLATLDLPFGVAADEAGNIYIADTGNNVFRVVNSSNVISTFAGTGTLGNTCPAGSVPTICTFEGVSGIFASPSGDIYLSDVRSGGIFVVDKAGKTYPVEEDLGGALSYLFVGGSDLFAGTYGPYFIAMDTKGQVITSNAFAEVVTSAGSTGILTFGNQNIGTTSNAMFIQLFNPGAAALTFSGTPTITGPYAISGGTCNLNAGIAPGADCTLGVVFKPTAAGITIPGTIVLTSNASSTPSTIELSGNGVGEVLTSTLTPASLTFSATVNTTSGAQTATFTNTSGEDFTISGISVTANSGFAETNNCGATLASETFCTINVTFSPTQATTYSGTLTVTSESTSPSTVSLSGTGTAAAAPVAGLAPTTLSFPNTTVNATSAAMTTTLTNSGNAVLNISGITLAGTNPTDFSETNNCGSTLAASAHCTISVTFTPASAASFAATLSVADDAAGSPQTVTLSGTGIVAAAPVASLSPTTLSFPNTTVGSTATAMVTTLSNTGNAVLNISGITIGGANPGDFAKTTTCGTTLAASAMCTISVTFTPASAASFAATVSVADNAAGSPQTVTLSGAGTAPAAPVASLSPTTLSFPNTTVGSTATAMVTTLSNTGNAVLNISGITIGGANPGDFAKTTTCGTTLAASAMCTISVTFTPASAASFAATVSVADNAAGSPQTVTLSGAGTAPAAPVASLSPGSVTFANTPSGTTTAAQVLTLSNTGNAVLDISGITIGGANPADFAETSTCGASLAAGANCTISVTFTPASIASFAATVSVADNAAGSPQTATLAGAGVTPPDFTVSSSTPTVTVEPGAAAVYNLAITPTNGDFNSVVTLSASGLPAGATVSFAPASVTPGGSATPSVMTVQTVRQEAQMATPRRWGWIPATTLAFCVPLFWWRRRNRSRLLATGLLCLMFSAGATFLVGCGGGFALSQPPATYTLTVTGTSGADTHSTTVTLTVQ